MKEEAQGFPTAWGSIGFPLHPKALRTHHREKPDLSQGRARNYLLPHSVLEDRSKKKAGLGSSSNPKNYPQILKQERGSQPFGHLKWPGVGQNELIGGSGGALKAAWLITFSRV